MSRFIIQGGKPLRGAVRLGGAKNASFKLMIAATLGSSESRLLNLSHIGDVEVTQKTLEQLGVRIVWCGERTIFIYPQDFVSTQIASLAGEKSRGSTLYAAVLLAKKREAVIPMPGGCSLGPRPIDRHLQGFEALGATVKIETDRIILRAQDGLRGATYHFLKKSHTGTEAMILAAVLANGKTRLENAALEPEIDDMIAMLNGMGAKISRVAGESIEIEGVQKLGGVIYSIMPDRNEAVSYAVAALATKGDIVVENAKANHLQTFLNTLDAIHARYEIADYGIRFWYDQPLLATSIKTSPEPGFMTDWQPLWTLLMTQAKGRSEVVETVSNNRLQFTQQLKNIGAKITLFNPDIEDKKAFYEFDCPDEDATYHGARIEGPTSLQAGNHQVLDLRAGATMTIAALIAHGTSVIEGIDQIQRGYQNLDGRLRDLGAEIVTQI